MEEELIKFRKDSKSVDFFRTEIKRLEQ